MSNRLDQEREKELQPQRMLYAIEKLNDLDIVCHIEDETKIQFDYKGEIVTFYPYSGWHTGKSIKDGRGLHNLLKQIKPTTNE